MFPPRFRGSVFIAQHGSWARSQRIGYRVAVVTLGADHRTSVGYDAEFLTGFLLPNNTIWVCALMLQEMVVMSVFSRQWPQRLSQPCLFSKNSTAMHSSCAADSRMIAYP